MKAPLHHNVFFFTHKGIYLGSSCSHIIRDGDSQTSSLFIPFGMILEQILNKLGFSSKQTTFAKIRWAAKAKEMNNPEEEEEEEEEAAAMVFRSIKSCCSPRMRRASGRAPRIGSTRPPMIPGLKTARRSSLPSDKSCAALSNMKP